MIYASKTNVSIPKNADPIVSIYNHLGRGAVDFFALEFNSTSIYFEVYSDGILVYSLTIRDLTSMHLKENMPVYRKDNGIFITPKDSIPFKTSFEIKAKSSTSSSSRYLDNIVVMYDHSEAFRD